MSVPRSFPGGVTLDDGRFLVAGGYVDAATVTRTAEIWNPANGTWSPAGSLNAPRAQFVMLKLPGGKVLAAGGYNGSAAVATAEVYDPGTDTWQSVGPMTVPRFAAMGALLGDGRVLVTGGPTTSGYTAATELFDPRTATWSTADPLPGTARGYGAATTLPDGRVMIAGGYSGEFNGEVAIFSDHWTAVRSMPTPRDYLGLSVLPNGKVLATGGATTGSAYTNVVEVYDLLTGNWSSAPALATNHFAHNALTLGSGKVLVVAGYVSSATGGGTAAELYDPTTNAWSPAGSLTTNRWVYASGVVPDGRVLVAGGATGPGSNIPTQTAEVWTPTTSVVTDPALAFGEQRIGTGVVAGVQLTNTGDAPLLTDNYALAGIDPGDFSVNPERCHVVAPSATCVIDVSFSPSALGARSATLTFSANTTGGIHAVPLSGRGTADTDGDGILDGTDRCPRLRGSASREGCPSGLLADPSIRYRAGKRSIRVLAYYVKATKGARVTVSCSKKGCKRTVTVGRGSKRVRIRRLAHHRLTNGTKITVTVAKSGRLTTTVVDRVTHGRRIEGRPSCTEPGTTSPRIGC